MPTTVIKWHFVLKQIVFLSSNTHSSHKNPEAIFRFMNYDCSEIIRTCPFKQLLKTSIIVLTEICMMRVAISIETKKQIYKKIGSHILEQMLLLQLFCILQPRHHLNNTFHCWGGQIFIVLIQVCDKKYGIINSFVDNMPWLPPFWFTDNRSNYNLYLIVLVSMGKML